MKVSAFVFVTFLTVPSAAISTANAHDQCVGSACKHYSRTGTAFDIAQQYSNGGQFAGITSGSTGTMLDIAWDSLDVRGTLDRFASAWRVPPAVAKGK